MGPGTARCIEVERLGGLIWATVQSLDCTPDTAGEADGEVLSFGSEQTLQRWLVGLLGEFQDDLQVVLHSDDPALERAVDDAREEALRLDGAPAREADER